MSTSPTPQPTSILVVDDEPSNLMAVDAILEPLHQRIVHARSAEEALKHALREEFSVVLLDVQMPGMDGFECAQLLRRRPRTRDVPIIFVTAISREQRFIARGYDVGAVDYMLKPYEPDILRSKVKVFVELAQKNAIIRAQHETLQRISERELADFKRQSEKHYAALADSMPQIVWTADLEGTVHYANLRWAELAEGSWEFAAVVHPDDLPRFLAGWQGAVESGEGWEDELRFGNATLGYRTHLVRAVPRLSSDGTVDSWIGISTDIDARVRADRAFRMLSEVSRKLGGALEDPTVFESAVRTSLPVLGDAAVLAVGKAGEDVPEHAFTATLDVLPEGVLSDPRLHIGASQVGFSGHALLHLDVEAELREAQSGRSPDERGQSKWDHLRYLHELGITGYMCLPLSVRGRDIGSLTFLRGNGTYGQGEVALAEDVARRMATAVENARLHETTERRRVELEQANKSKDVFLATLSHELRTPLNAIVGWTDMLRNGSLNGDEIPRATETIERNAQSLSQLVADLLDVSRIVTGSLKIETKVVGLAPIVHAVIDAARPAANAKRLKLDVTVACRSSISADVGRLRQVLGNLLSNAIKFTPDGGAISLSATDADGCARIVIADSGEGITEDLLPFVFDRFRQAEAARTRGLGLGLAIVKHLVEDHGGRVHAASEGSGKGSTFTVELPIVEGAAPAEESIASLPPSGQPDLQGVHALLVEDDPDGNELMTTILERYGARVTSVMTAGAALDALAAEFPDILVSDIGLPDTDGIELIKTVRGTSPNDVLPAIALTAYASRQDAAKALAAGFDAHVAKPVQPGTLGAEVARLVGTRESIKKSGVKRSPAA